jgi:hypothetical protein
MIYEIRTYTLHPGKVRDYEARFAEGYTVREKYSPLYGFWHTEIGPLNQVVHIWPYESLQQRDDLRKASAADPSGKWPPNASEFAMYQENDILIPIPGMTEHKGPQQWGNLYELRMYTYPAGEVQKVATAFTAALPAREAVYPVVGIWTSDLGNLNRLYQLFVYKDWAHRDELRAEMRAKKIWPPQGESSHPMTQLVRHMVPAAYSPLH